MSIQGTHFKGPLLGSRASFGGAAENLTIDAIAGESDLVTTFDDFNTYVNVAEFGAADGLENIGWVVGDIGVPAGDGAGINDDGSIRYESALRVNAGTAPDTGGHLKINPLATASRSPHIWLADNGSGANPAVLDNTTFIFACRLGFESNVDGGWDGKVFVGMAGQTDTAILVVTGDGDLITLPAGDPMLGFHVLENGSVRGVAIRDETITSLVDGTHFTELLAADSVDNAAADTPTWIDLALRMVITDMSDNAANGSIEFFYRRGVPATVTLGRPGVPPSQRLGDWTKHPTVLNNQTPNNDAVLLVPTIEVLNGPTNQSDLLVDWWAMGISRYSRT